MQAITTNNNKHFFTFHIKQYWHFHWVYSQTILHTFPDIKQYWDIQRVTGKQYYMLFQSLYGFCALPHTPHPPHPHPPLPIIMGELNLKFIKIMWGQNFFLLNLWGKKPLWGKLKLHGGETAKHPEKWSLSFKNFFWKCECISSCYLTIS